MTEPEPLQQIDHTYVIFRGRKYSYFSGCDYFRLASHPEVAKALSKGLERYGLNVAASRLTTGNHKCYYDLERELKRFFGAQDALVVSTGYVTNLIVAQALAGSFSHVLVDERSHPTLADAAKFFDCPILRFQHRDVQDAAQAVKRCGLSARPILLTDGMYARDGAAAPLREYLKILPADGFILVDDAHGAGVLGPTGQGTLEHAGVARKRVIQCITLSKAFGVYGGAILGTPQLRRQIIERSGMFVGSTPLPLPLVSAAVRSAQILRGDKTLRARMVKNSQYLKAELRGGGFPVPDQPGPIVNFCARNASASNRMSQVMLAAGIFPPFVKYPGGPKDGSFRFVISSEHTRPQLDALARTLKSQLALFVDAARV